MYKYNPLRSSFEAFKHFKNIVMVIVYFRKSKLSIIILLYGRTFYSKKATHFPQFSSFGVFFQTVLTC